MCKRLYNKSEKTAHKKGENIFKLYILQTP